MNMFKPTAAKTPTEYFSQITDPARKKEVLAVHKLITKTLPKLKPRILVGMIGYGSFHYKSASGREGDWSLVALASQKNYISVYVCALEGGTYLAEKYKSGLGKVSVGKSCIRFKRLEDVNLVALEKLLKMIPAATPLGG